MLLQLATLRLVLLVRPVGVDERDAYLKAELIVRQRVHV